MKKYVTLLFLVLSACSSFAQQMGTPVQFATGFASPTDIKNCGDSRIFVVEQSGRIKVLDSLGNINPTPFLDIHTSVGTANDEQGLLGLVFDPNYATNGYFYVDYTDNITALHVGGSTGLNTQISRFTVSSTNPDSADPASELKILNIYQPYWNHNGGNLQFGPDDGYLYIDMGDGGSGGDPGHRAQNLDSLLGKMLRIDVHVSVPPYYSSPPTNPFVGIAGRDEIWEYGLRNPWRASFDKITHDLWIADVGQNTYEEIDFQKAGSPGGKNFGWHCFESFHSYSAAGPDCSPLPVDTVNPLTEYSHTSLNCSVTGGYVYRGGQWADLFGYYFYEDYCSGKMRSLKPNGTGGWVANNNVGSFLTYSYTTFGQDSKGELYIASRGTSSPPTFANDGKVFKLRGLNCKPTAAIYYNNSFPDTIQFCLGAATFNFHAITGDSLIYEWMRNGNPIIGANGPNYTADSTGSYTLFVMNGSGCTNTSKAVVLMDTCCIQPVDISFNSSFPDTINMCPGVPVNLNAVSAGTLTYAWKRNGTPISGAASQNYNADSAGVYTVFVTNGATGCMTSSKIVLRDTCSGNFIHEIEDFSGTDIYPNPTAGGFTVAFSLNQTAVVDFEIQNTLGQKMIAAEKLMYAGKNQFQMNDNRLSEGLYFVSLRTEKGQMIRKLVVSGKN